MTNREHERALDLITRRGVEDIAAAGRGLAGVAPGDLRRMFRIRRAGGEHGPASAVGCDHRQPGAGDHHASPAARSRDVSARAALPHGADRDFILHRSHVVGAFSVVVVAIRRLGGATCGTLSGDRRTGNSAVSAAAGNRDRRLAAGVSTSHIRRLTHAGVGEGA